MPSTIRSLVEPSFGHDFGNVRVHADAAAARSATALGAAAYSVGRHVVFGAGLYAPQHRRGRHLLAHELAHVVQSRHEPTIVRRKPQAQANATQEQEDATKGVLIANVEVLEGDDARTIMRRALVQFGLTEKQAREFADTLELTTLSAPTPETPYPVYLTEDAVQKLGKQLEAYEEGTSTSPSRLNVEQKPGADANEGPASESETERHDGEDGLGLIEVPEWVVRVLSALDTILTIISLVTAGGAAVAMLKALAKKLMKQAIKRAVRKAALEAATEVVKEAMETITKRAAREGLEEAVTEAVKAKVKEKIRKSAQKAAREALRRSMRKASEKEIRQAAKELAEEISEEVAQKAASKTAKKAIRDATKAFLTRAGRLKNAEKAIVDSKRVVNYTLNPNHLEGKHKALQLQRALGVDSSHSASFIQQLFQGIKSEQAVLGKLDQYGQHFTVYIRMTGPGGTAVVETGWIYDIGSTVPRFLTALVSKM